MENTIKFCCYLWVFISNYKLEVIVYGPPTVLFFFFNGVLHHHLCRNLLVFLRPQPVIPDVVLGLVVLPGEIASRALAGDLDHGELFTVAGEITGRLARTGIGAVLLLLCCNTMAKKEKKMIKKRLSRYVGEPFRFRISC